MSKLPAPIANYNSAPVPRPIPHAYGAQDANRIPNGSIAEVLDGEPRRAFGQRYLRRSPEVEFERPRKEPYGFTAARSARTDNAPPTPHGPSAAFLAQLIGQAVQDLGTSGGPEGPGEPGLAHNAYRQAGEAPSPRIEIGNQVNFAV